MENREVILARLHAAAQRLPQYESEYQNLSQRDYDHVYPLVQGYILDRFLLTEEMCASEKLLDLADVSLRYMLALKRMGIDPGQISRSCSGASSVISKKVLLMKAVQEIFHVSMTPAEFAEISTVSELAAFICSQPQENTAQKLVVQEKYTEEVAHSFDVWKIRQDFPALSQTIHGHPLVYLDNAATMQMPVQVMEAVREVELLRGNVHRGIHTLSSRCTDAYEQARAACAQFFGTEPGHITFTSGTTDGITAIQMDIKIHGLTRPIVEEAIARTREARVYIMDEVMSKAIAEPRKEVNQWAPKIEQITIDPNKIGDVVGQKGKTINEIIARTGVKIDITDDGAVSVCGTDKEAIAKAIDMIKIITTDFKEGQIFTGTVVSIKEFGAFIEFAPGKEGMVHISKIAKERIEHVEDVLTLGDVVKVVCLGKDKMGRISFSIKDVPADQK